MTSHPLAPDLLPPGHHAVRHELVLEWPADAGWRFVASPVRGFGGTTVIAAGEPFDFSGKYGTRIYAVPAAAPLPNGDQRLGDVAWPNAAVPVAEIASVPIGHPLARVVTTVRVTAVRNGTIEFVRTGEQRFDTLGHELGALTWLPLAVTAAAGAFWLTRLARAQRAAEERP